MLKRPTSILTGNVFNDRRPVLGWTLDYFTYFMGFLSQNFHFQHLAIIPFGSHAYKYVQMNLVNEN